jgi:hypothetical protein
MTLTDMLEGIREKVKIKFHQVPIHQTLLEKHFDQIF